MTLTPGSGPVSSETVPEIVFSCAKEIYTNNTSNSVKKPLSFVLIVKLFELITSKILIQNQITKLMSIKELILCKVLVFYYKLLVWIDV